MKNLGTQLNKYQGQDAYIFGKGPSLDSFDFSLAGELRICINESLKIVTKPTYFFAHDEKPIKHVSEEWPDACFGILQEVRAKYACQCGIPEDQLLTYTLCHGNKSVLEKSPEEIARENILYGQLGTVHSALHFCNLLGVSKVFLVGFDGTARYADSFKHLPPGWNHDKIRAISIEILNTLKIPFEFCLAQKENPLC